MISATELPMENNATFFVTLLRKHTMQLYTYKLHITYASN
jgi:hypothetical protein